MASSRELRFPQAWAEASMSPAFFDEFHYFVSTDFWTSLVTGGTVAMASTEAWGPALQLVGDGTIEHECAAYGTTAGFLPALSHPIALVAGVQFAQGATNKIEMAFGLTNLATGAGLMQAAGAGPIASGSQVIMYTVNLSTVWHTQSRNGSTFTDTTSTTTAADATNMHELKIEIQDMSQTQCVVTYSVDGVRLKSSAAGLVYPDISDVLSYASLARMRPIIYLRCGAGNAETVNVDYFGGWQLRQGSPQLYG